MSYLYYNINLRITIANRIQFTVCNAIHIESSVQVLFNSATITLPREFRNAGLAADPQKSIDISGKSILDFMQRGDAIKIEFGYDGDLQTEFEGYISNIGAETPLVIDCKDEMFQLKKAPRVTKFIKTGKLLDILKAVVPKQYTIECDADYSIGKWLLEDITPYNVLEELREKAGIRAYFKNPKTLCVGMVIDFKPTKTHEYNFSQNVRRGSNLKFVETLKPLLIKVQSRQANGKNISVEKGEKGGDERTITLWPNVAKPELQKWLDARHSTDTKDGFTGTLDGWCYPRTKPGDVAQLNRPFYADSHQDGKYFIEAVTIDVNGADGIKRANQLSYKL